MSAPTAEQLLKWPMHCTMAEQAPLWVPDMPLYDWQLETLVAAQQYHSRVALSTGNEFGKTAILGPIFIFSIMAAFPFAYVYATSASERQVKEQLFEDQLIPRAEQMGWQVKRGEGKIIAPNGSQCLCYKCTTADNVEGFHGKLDSTVIPGKTIYRPAAYYLDECKGISDPISFAALRRIDPDFALCVSTPPLNHQGWFFEAISPDNLDKMVRLRQAKGLGKIAIPANCYQPNPLYDFEGEYFTSRRIVHWNQCPHLHTPKKKNERKNIIKKFGKNSPYVLSMLYGEFSASGEGNNIFQPEDIEGLKEAMLGHADHKPLVGDTRAAGDATQGGDSMVLGVRNGTEVLLQDECEETRTGAQAEYWVRILNRLNIAPWQFTIDGIGVGKDIADVMEDSFNYKGIVRFGSNHAPLIEYAYADRYTEILFAIRELIRWKVLRLKWNENLIRDCRDRCYIEMTGTGKIKAEPKQQARNWLGYSPDWLDMLIYLFSDFNFGAIRRGDLLTRPDAPPPPEGAWKFKADPNAVKRTGALLGLKKQEKMVLKKVGR